MTEREMLEKALMLLSVIGVRGRVSGSDEFLVLDHVTRAWEEARRELMAAVPEPDLRTKVLEDLTAAINVMVARP